MTDLERIANHYGLAHQLSKTTEELDELSDAIFEHKELDEPVDHIIEEIADVEIMTAQLKSLLGCEAQVEEIKVAKIKRQLGRMSMEVNFKNARRNNA